MKWYADIIINLIKKNTLLAEQEGSQLISVVDFLIKEFAEKLDDKMVSLSIAFHFLYQIKCRLNHLSEKKIIIELEMRK